MTSLEPVLKPIAIVDLRPTQIAVGFREVAEKRKRFRALSWSASYFMLPSDDVPLILEIPASAGLPATYGLGSVVPLASRMR